MLVGRYHANGKAKVTLSGKVGDKKQSFDFPADLVDKSDDDTNAFVAKLWATRRVGDIIDELDLKGRNEELVNELVALATEHGILTPYTSFLADETSDVRQVTENRLRALNESEALEETSGAVRLRPTRRQSLASTRRPGAGRCPNACALSTVAVSRLAAWAVAAATSAATSNTTTPQKDKHVAADNIRQIGRKTFFQRGNQWVDSTVNESDEKSAKKIERFSREYFDLVEKYGQHVAQYLAVDEPIIIKLGDQTYTW